MLFVFFKKGFDVLKKIVACSESAATNIFYSFDKARIIFYKLSYISIYLSFGINSKATPFMQCRLPVVFFGPSLKECPK
jgi:hypothetical protein